MRCACAPSTWIRAPARRWSSSRARSLRRSDEVHVPPRTLAPKLRRARLFAASLIAAGCSAVGPTERAAPGDQEAVPEASAPQSATPDDQEAVPEASEPQSAAPDDQEAVPEETEPPGAAPDVPESGA